MLILLCLDLNCLFSEMTNKNIFFFFFFKKSLTFILKSRLTAKPFKPLKLFLINAELSPLQIKSNGTYGDLLSPRLSPQMTDALYKTPGVTQAVETSPRHLPINFVVLWLWMECATRWFDGAAPRWPIGDRGSASKPTHSGSCSSKRRHLQEMVWQMPGVIKKKKEKRKVLPTPNDTRHRRGALNKPGESHVSQGGGDFSARPRGDAAWLQPTSTGALSGMLLVCERDVKWKVWLGFDLWVHVRRRRWRKSLN